MPIPTVTCSVCNQMVNKAQTYSVGDGKRACKSHEGVVAKAEALKKQRKNDIKAEQVRQESFRKKRFDYVSLDGETYWQRAEKWNNGTCWLCNSSGVDASIVAQRMLVAMERLKIKNVPFDFFHMGDQLRGEMKLEGLKALKTFDLPTDHRRGKIFQAIKKNAPNHGAVEFAEFIQLIRVCPDCAKEYGFEFMPKINMDIDQLMNFAAVMEVTTKPIIRAVAAAELVLEDVEKRQNERYQAETN